MAMATVLRTRKVPNTYRRRWAGAGLAPGKADRVPRVPRPAGSSRHHARGSSSHTPDALSTARRGGERIHARSSLKMSSEQHPKTCRCHETGHGPLGQDLDELDFQKSACYAAMVGDIARLERILDRHPEQLHQDGRSTDDTACDVHSSTPSGYSPLIYASRAGQVDAVKLLLRRGARVNQQTREMRSTALHRAAVAGHEEVVRLLLDAGADTSIRDCDGLTAMERVSRQRDGRAPQRAGVLQLLEEAENRQKFATSSSRWVERGDKM